MRSYVSIIIVNYNGKKDTLACIKSIFASFAKNHNLTPRIIVIDNGSQDGLDREISRENKLEYYNLGRNTGFTGGVNAGLRIALEKKCDYVWLLNNDTVIDQKSLDFMQAFSDSGIGAVGSKIYFYPGTEYHHNYRKSDLGKVIWYAGGIIDWKNMYASHRGVDEVDNGQYEEVQDTDFITGCSFIIRTDTVRKVGFLDEKYFLYFEDLDYSIRIRKAGFRTVYYPGSAIWHKNAQSSGRPGSRTHIYYQNRNRILAAFRYAPARTKIALLRQSLYRLFTASAVEKKAIRDAVSGNYGRYEP